AGGVGERGVVEDQRVRGGTAETVLALLEPQECGECQPPAVAGKSADALGAPRIDAGAFGLQIGGGPDGGEQNRCRGANARALIPVHGASSRQACGGRILCHHASRPRISSRTSAISRAREGRAPSQRSGRGARVAVWANVRAGGGRRVA